MLAFLIRLVLALRSLFDASATRQAEIIVLRHTLMVLDRKAQKRVGLRNIDRLILVWLYRIVLSVLDVDEWYASYAGDLSESDFDQTVSLSSLTEPRPGRGEAR
jgi:hypothetical protein